MVVIKNNVLFNQKTFVAHEDKKQVHHTVLKSPQALQLLFFHSLDLLYQMQQLEDCSHKM